jgi:hypothetical protein
MTDAALVLRHSIHQSSARNTDAHSHYDFKMYAIVHSQAVECSHLLRDAGFEIIIKNAPVQPKVIQGEFLRKTFVVMNAVVTMNSSNYMPILCLNQLLFTWTSILFSISPWMMFLMLSCTTRTR